MKTLEARRLRRIPFPIGVVLVVAGLNWPPYPIGPGTRSAMFGAGIALIAVAFWTPGAAVRVRAMMAGIAAVGLLLGLFLMALRRDRYLERSRIHSFRAHYVKSVRGVFVAVPGGFPETTGGFALALNADLGGPIHLYRDVEAVEIERWHEAMAAKYRLAASRPWAGVEPDTGPPFDETIDRSIAAKAEPTKGAR